ncbi:type I methionyl aminopeptidase [Buchnera aphidicola (Taiwanaphis decaspermi)]|uniref:type I methionyl aminopeptidase n=1 Tax=Buchnera aphidicola TaxID=9 RepID=UPI0031B84C37
MNVLLKNKSEIKKIKIASKIASEVLEMIKSYVIPNITTLELNDICHDFIIKKKAIPGCLGYQGFPKSVCISVNDIVCHGIPNKNKKLKNGDIVNIDVTVVKNKYYSDTSKMFFVGKPSILSKRLCYVAKKSLYLAIKVIKPEIKLYKIGETIQKYVEKKGFSVVRDYCGHGIGRYFHEEPQILHYKSNKNNLIIKKNMVFTIEPMINAGSKSVKCMKDGWTVKTKDRSLSAQYEHTVLITKNGCEILTKREKENIKNN